MARKITEDACRAFHNGYDFKKSNTEIGRYYESGSDDFGWCMWLHNNGIAKRMNGRLYIRSAGWRTLTTKERLNGISGVNVYQSNFDWYLNGELWENDSEWTEVK